MTAVWIALIFITFCCLVAWLVRREEERQYQILLAKFYQEVPKVIADLTRQFQPLIEALNKTNEAFKEFGLALNKAQYVRDPYRRFINVESDLL